MMHGIEIAHDPDDEASAGVFAAGGGGRGERVNDAKQIIVNGVGLDISAEYLDRHAKPRGCGMTPSGALDELPLFAGVTP